MKPSGTRCATSLRLVPGTYVATADALLASFTPQEAIALCDGAIDVQEKVGLIAPDKVYDWDAPRCRSEALLAQRRAREALGPLERSVTLTRRVFPWDLPRAKLALARALLETHGDASRARARAGGAKRHDVAPLRDETLRPPGAMVCEPGQRSEDARGFSLPLKENAPFGRDGAPVSANDRPAVPRQAEEDWSYPPSVLSSYR